MSQAYYELTRLIERLHRRYLDVLRAELNRQGVKDVNPVQCLLLLNIGTEEVNVRNLMERGYYQGSNASYNIKKLVESGYLTQERAAHDRRSTIIRVAEKGHELCAKIRAQQDEQAESLCARGSGERLEDAVKTLRDLERTWTDFIRYRAA